MAEIVIVPDAAAAGELVADEIVALVADEAGCRARPRDRVHARWPSTRRSPAPDGATVRGCAASRSTSTSACPPGTGELPLGDHPRGRRAARARPPRSSTCPTARRRHRARPAPTTSARSPTAGGVDLQILGIGTDGHIGFNEPGSSFASLTRVKTLTEQTRRDNARFFDSLDEVPTHCITQGLGTILRARAPGAARVRRGQGRGGRRRGRGPGHREHARLGRSSCTRTRRSSSTRPRPRSWPRDYYRYAWEHRLPWETL